jgi:hypothetical protein
MLSTAHEVILFSSDAQPQPLVRYTLQDAEKWDIAGLRFPPSGLFLLELTPRRYSPYNNREARRAVYFKLDGTLDHQLTLPDLPGVGEPRMFNVVEDYIGPALAPPAVVLASSLFGSETSPPPDPQQIHENVRNCIVNYSTALLCAVGMFLLARRRQFRMRAVWFWTVLTLLLGPVGIVLLLCTCGLSTLARCAGCAQLRPVTADLCPHCGAAPAMPARRGTEIFV